MTERVKLLVRADDGLAASYDAELVETPVGFAVRWSEDGTVTKFTLADSHAHLVREGDSMIRLSFVMGEVTLGTLATAGGELPLSTELIKLEKGERHLRLAYRLWIGDDAQARTLDISWIPV